MVNLYFHPSRFISKDRHFLYCTVCTGWKNEAHRLKNSWGFPGLKLWTVKDVKPWITDSQSMLCIVFPSLQILGTKHCCVWHSLGEIRRVIWYSRQDIRQYQMSRYSFRFILYINLANHLTTFILSFLV